MATLLGLINASVFIGISAVHFYWALGGKKGLDVALPQFEGDKKVFLPSGLMTVCVALIFFTIAIFTMQGIGFLDFYVPYVLKKYGFYCLATIMFLRAIGDFRYVGFFKTIKNTEFGRYDSQYYAPLCLILGVFFILIEILK